MLTPAAAKASWLQRWLLGLFAGKRLEHGGLGWGEVGIGGQCRHGEVVFALGYAQGMILAQMLKFTVGWFCAVGVLGAGAAGGRDAYADIAWSGPPETWRVGRSQALLALLDEHVEWTLREDPLTATSRGDTRYNDRLRDESPEATTSRTAEIAERLVRLKSMGREDSGRVVWSGDWVEDDQTDADLLLYELSIDLESAKFHHEQMPISHQSGPQVWLPQMADSLAIVTAKDLADFASRLEGVPKAIDQTIAQMRLGLAAGRVPSRVVMVGVDEQAARLGSEEVVATPSLSPFYKPFRGRAEGDVDAARARRVISTEIAGAYRRLAEFLRDEYIPKCRVEGAGVGASEGVDGPAAYDHALRRHTTMNLTSSEIHAIGLGEVARLRAAMIRAIGRTDYAHKAEYAGDELFTKFVEHLRTDKRFYCTTADELLAGYRDIAKKVDPALPRLFGHLPRLSYGVRELPRFAAPSSPTAYYYHGSVQQGVPGFFMANTYRLDQRPRYEMTALTLHEACPGHHLQIAIAQELEGVHPFRTLSGYTAFVEGWGLYAERLGLEIAPDGSGELVQRVPEGEGGAGGTGLYSDPYDEFGRLTYEMWRACRLVVDTGLHAGKWTRERAIAYMMANTALSPFNIEREVDRYIAWPGQACAYKIGQLKISELRARAEKRLADRFKIREFHDMVLGAGAIPLPTLEARIDRWIAQRASE